MVHAAVREAISQRLCLELEYDGYMRVVEPHVYGRDASGLELLRAWQLRGGATRDEASGWKLLDLSEVTNALAISEQAYVPRIGYRRPDPDIIEVITKI